jgi:hypothetical protein
MVLWHRGLRSGWGLLEGELLLVLSVQMRLCTIDSTVSRTRPGELAHRDPLLSSQTRWSTTSTPNWCPWTRLSMLAGCPKASCRKRPRTANFTAPVRCIKPQPASIKSLHEVLDRYTSIRRKHLPKRLALGFFVCATRHTPPGGAPAPRLFVGALCSRIRSPTMRQLQPGSFDPRLRHKHTNAHTRSLASSQPGPRRCTRRATTHPTTARLPHTGHDADQVSSAGTAASAPVPDGKRAPPKTALTGDRVRTLTGKEIELDIEADYKVRAPPARLSDPRGRAWHSADGSTGLEDKGARRGEGGHPARAAAAHLRREADVSEHAAGGCRG